MRQPRSRRDGRRRRAAAVAVAVWLGLAPSEEGKRRQQVASVRPVVAPVGRSRRARRAIGPRVLPELGELPPGEGVRLQERPLPEKQRERRPVRLPRERAGARPAGGGSWRQGAALLVVRRRRRRPEVGHGAGGDGAVDPRSPPDQPVGIQLQAGQQHGRRVRRRLRALLPGHGRMRQGHLDVGLARERPPRERAAHGSLAQERRALRRGPLRRVLQDPPPGRFRRRRRLRSGLGHPLDGSAAAGAGHAARGQRVRHRDRRRGQAVLHGVQRQDALALGPRVGPLALPGPRARRGHLRHCAGN
mmetsp:Transcript_3581/g.9028  ORF Transcript_3581/g.9028 Transcript_3581/m.9028 type:complete len:303 (+) Transcript_3581:405-1313(+)